ncbi:hypothetical protein Tco_0105560 [Tanacetum coccineum]
MTVQQALIVDESLEMIEDESLELIEDESLEMIEDESLDMIVDETLKLDTVIADSLHYLEIIFDQRAVILLNSSLTEEAVAEDETEIKLHWFVCGLGASFETFSTAIRTTKPFTTFRDLLSQAESHEMFLKSLHGSATPPVAFFSQQCVPRSARRQHANKTTLEVCTDILNALFNTSLVHFSREIGPPISKNAPVPESRPPIQGLIFESCGLCPVPTTALNQIHDQTNAFITVSTENIKEQLHQPTVMNVSSHGAPPATAPTEPSSVHQMKTRSKSGIFKTKHSPDFVSLTSHALHAALFLCAPKGFKSAAKHPQWMAAMHDEMEALNKIVLGLLYHVHLLLILLVPNGFIESNIMLMARLKGLKHVWWLRVLLKFRVSIIPTHHPYVKELLTGGNCSNLWSGFIDPQFPNHVCKFSKHVRLKPAPRALVSSTKSFLLAHGFVGPSSSIRASIFNLSNAFYDMSRVQSHMVSVIRRSIRPILCLLDAISSFIETLRSLMDIPYFSEEATISLDATRNNQLEVQAQIPRIFLDGYDVLDLRINFFIFLCLSSRMHAF